MPTKKITNKGPKITINAEPLDLTNNFRFFN